ncbi:SpaA isopeptide-forming pilin-related protein [Bifidobacterium felsineum]|nr:isopeptide-forming domain-containing fimbrial protein [Bifidobacterium felsineum]MBT1163196.1 isopeptide-forming domain-containing fimbrial protein [Bifidobacterium felsineum]
MKMRKLFAGLAAAATLFGGLAMGAMTANAVDVDGNNVVTSNATFKFTADDASQWTGRTIKYYKLADYVQYDANSADTTAAQYGVQTAAGANRAAIKTALEAAVANTTPALTVPNDNTTDLMAWALQQGALDKESAKPWTGSTRNFAQSLKTNALVTGDTTNLKEATLAVTGTDRTVSLPAGVYLFLDTAAITDATITEGQNGNIQQGDENGDKGGKVVTQSAPIVIASGTVSDGAITDPLKDTTDPTNNASGDNIVALKNHVSPVAKTVNDNDKTVSTGQVVTYTLTSELPAVTTGFDNYKFTLTDTPGIGQTVDLSKDFIVKVGGAELAAHDQTTNPTGYELTFNKQVEQVEQTAKKFDGNGSKAFIIDLSKYVNSKKADEPLADTARVVEVTYKATINENAKTNHSVPNTVEVNDNNSKAEDKTKLTLGKFAFTKTDAQGNALQGAEFTITAAEDDTSNDKDDNPTVPTDADRIATSNSDGVVTFDGLADGVYEVTETKVPEGFLGHVDSGDPTVAAKFKVTIKDGEATKFQGTDLFGLALSLDNPTTSGDNNLTNYKVKNVKNITELPKTGAAGIALFFVIAALLAGAGVTVYLKSRATKRALHA